MNSSSALGLLLLLVSASVAASAGGGLAETAAEMMRGCQQHLKGGSDPEAWSCFQGLATEALKRSLESTLDRWDRKDIQLGDNVVLAVGPEEAKRAPKTLNFKMTDTAQIVDTVINFISGRTLQVRIPKEILPSNLDEARGKLKKMGGTLLAGLLMMKGTLGALALGALALISGKALLLSVLSLTLTLIAALKKVSSGHDHHRRSGRRADEPEGEWVASASVAPDHKVQAVAATAHHLAYRNQHPYQYTKS